MSPEDRAEEVQTDQNEEQAQVNQVEENIKGEEDRVKEELTPDGEAEVKEEKEEPMVTQAQETEEAHGFDEISDSGETPTKRDLDFLLDIPLEVSVEVGRTKLLINDLLQLGQGSVIELNKLAGEPMEILVNNKLIARGEVVVVNEKFGIRLTDIISPMERVQQLS